MITRRLRLPGLLAAAIAATASASFAQDQYQPPATASAIDFIDVFEQLNGSQPGVRKGHA